MIIKIKTNNMCLIVNRCKHLLRKPKKARKDIECYKLLKNLGYGYFVTPFMYVHVNVKKGEYLEADRFEDSPTRGMFSPVVNHAIHTFRRPIKGVADTEVLVPCVIPKGTLYWIDDNNEEYASERIKFLIDYV